MKYYEKEIVDAFNKGREEGKQEAQKEFKKIVFDLELKYQKKWERVKNKSTVKAAELIQKEWRELKSKLKGEV